VDAGELVFLNPKIHSEPFRLSAALRLLVAREILFYIKISQELLREFPHESLGLEKLHLLQMLTSWLIFYNKPVFCFEFIADFV
jgi:hypothetical protein